MKMYKLRTYIPVLFIMLSTNVLFGQGNLLVTPVRVIFDAQKMHQDLTVSNIGQDTAVYLISFSHYRMNEDGSFAVLDKKDSSIVYADDYLRIFPRRVVLGPKESQTVRVQFRKPSTMKTGELRSHLYFRAEKNEPALGLKNPKSDSTKMSISITPIFGISIPIIARTGTPTLKVELSDVKLLHLNDSVAQLKLSICRTGEMSAYGNLKVVFKSDNGESVEVGVANGVGVYTELNKRNFTLQLSLKKGLKLTNGKLMISYTDESNGAKVELAKTEYNLN